MTNRSWVVLACVGVACVVGACALVDPVDNRYDTISRSLAKARNEAIFLNLVRASHDYPLSFTTISNVTPSLTNTSSLGLPNFLFGPHVSPYLPGTGTASAAVPAPLFTPGRDVIFNNTTASDTTAISTNFNVATQETGSFYEGFLKPIDLQILDYFIRQDYPRELLFWLFADSFQVGNPGFSALGYEYNPPVSYGCPRTDPKHLCFREWVWIAVLSGLTVEEKAIVKAESGGGAKSGGDSSSKGGKGETTIVARFCFSPQLARQAETQMGPTNAEEIRKKYMRFFDVRFASPICGQWKDADAQKRATEPQSDTFDFNVGATKFRVVSRSAYGVFEFLGNLMKIQRENIPPSLNARIPERNDEFGAESDPPRLLTTQDRELLITVLQNSPELCFSHTWFFDGDYCVPERATNTKRIFSLLAQLIAIETSATDLSITPIVRIVQ